MLQKNRVQFSIKELIFQIVLHIVVFIFYSFDKYHPHIGWHKAVFFLNYTFAALIINYFLLPRFLYREKYAIFFSYFSGIIIALMLLEELVLEQIFFPHTRGRNFPGLFFTLFQVLPVIIILAGFKFAWDALVKQRELEGLKAAIQESELQFLKSQINPHFLFNNLNNLYAYAIESSPKTPTIILELSSVLRYMLYECKEQFVPLYKEIEHLEDFTRLSQLQIEERGIVDFKAHHIQSDYQIAPLILIVFIENAFKHSQASQSDNILIDIEIFMTEEGKLDFFCKNNFQQLANTENLSKGIGLNNVKKRLQLLYPNAHQLTIIEHENQYEVYLSIQLTPQNISYELHHH
ncbi:MAG: histidine kinase [Microscillaceae bacterium]|nr:histidine kinase [Microscillaceae bacterium]